MPITTQYTPDMCPFCGGWNMLPTNSTGWLEVDENGERTWHPWRCRVCGAVLAQNDESQREKTT